MTSVLTHSAELLDSEVLQAIGVNLAVYVSNSLIDDSVNVVLGRAISAEDFSFLESRERSVRPSKLACS